jgi:hypothetical protein
VEPTGVEPTGVEPTGVDPTGVEPTGVEPTGVEPTGVDPTGVDPTGVEPTGVEFVDPAKNESQAFGMVEIGTWSIPAPAFVGVTFTVRFENGLGGALACVPQLGNEFRDGAPPLVSCA